jgi:exopolysaccharide biosynthesis WecB/TagA/CpsF family protein
MANFVGLTGTFVLEALGIAAAVAACYLLLLAVAGCFYRAHPPAGRALHRILVLIPAHDEAAVIGRCLDSLSRQRYPKALYELLVLADNCTDATAAIAQARGVRTLIRDDNRHRGKGFALQWALEQVLTDTEPAAAFVVVDADSVADENVLSALEAELTRGADAVQAEVTSMVVAGSPDTYLAASALLLFHRVRMAGRQRLGLGSTLCGNGMLLSRRLLEAHPWRASSCSEDLEYWLGLRMAGVRPVFTSAARIEAAGPADASEMDRQHRRWEGGRFAIAALGIALLMSAIIRRRRLSLLDAAAELAVPPLGVLAVIDLIGLGLSTLLFKLHVVPATVPELWLGAATAIVAFVVGGLRIAGAHAWAYLALLRAPVYLARKVRIYYGLVRHFDAAQWEPAPPSSSEGRSPLRLGAVPIDPVDMGTALDLLKKFLRRGSRAHVCTVNSHFLAEARMDLAVREVARRSDLNLADGWPVVWLGRLLGRAVPERVAGADLVPKLMTVCDEGGFSVFLLGGLDGAARDASRRIAQMHPGLIVAGWLEPPLTQVDLMDNDRIVSTINKSRADVLLVAFGNPKQELWIDQHRDALCVSLAIGVGSCFDLLAGRLSRAPLWMQAAGLEWVYRLCREPRRLAPRYAVDTFEVLRMVAWVLADRGRTMLQIPALRAASFRQVEPAWAEDMIAR